MSQRHRSIGYDGLNNGVAGHGGDAAVVVAVPRHHDVALHSPSGAPAVRKFKKSKYRHNNKKYIFDEMCV